MSYRNSDPEPLPPPVSTTVRANPPPVDDISDPALGTSQFEFMPPEEVNNK
jgi:hypothetical protein